MKTKVIQHFNIFEAVSSSLHSHKRFKYSCQSRSLQNSTIVKSRNKVLGLTEANLRFGGTSQEWNLSNLFISIPFLID